MRAIGALVIAGCVLSAYGWSANARPATPTVVAAAAGPVNLCTPPDEGTAGWTIVFLHGAAFRIPSDYATANNAFNIKLFEKGERTAAIQSWMGLGGLNETAMQQISSCQVVIGGRPAKITLLQGGNRLWWAVASWDPMPDGRSFDVYIIARYPNDLMSMRGILWSMEFPAYPVAEAPPKCDKPALPVVDVADVLDTGVVSMMAANSTPPLPTGKAVFEFTFDPTGALLPLEVTETDLSGADVNRLALLVGSNVKPQPAKAPRAAVRLTITPAGVSYVAVAASACPAS